MKLKELLHDLPVELVSGSDDVFIDHIAEDSRLIGPGGLFIARLGATHDGRAYIADALAGGAVAVLGGSAQSLAGKVTGLTAEDVPRAGAMLAERFYGNPSSRLKLVGITGTNGKTTTAHLAHQLLSIAHGRCGMIGTVQVDTGNHIRPASLTTPPAIEISSLLRRMVENECRACVMEASSHALDQERTSGLNFDIAIFTNLSGDHMDYHGSEAAYLLSKAKLFRGLSSDGFGLVNVDDPAWREIAHNCPGKVLTCSLEDPEADFYARIGSQTIDRIEVTLNGPWGEFEVALPLVGRHNVINALQAAAACHLLGVETDVLKHSLEACQAPPGRLEPVPAGDLGCTVLVDYAHTDDALENVLGALRPFVPASSHLRVVFGCGGDRDKSKRSRMARVACEYGDEVIITSDNPRTEDPGAIIADILVGVPEQSRATTFDLVDRRAAIELAIERSQPGDVLLIAGKGHEDYQIIGTTRRPFDDRVIAREAIRARQSGVALR